MTEVYKDHSLTLRAMDGLGQDGCVEDAFEARHWGEPSTLVACIISGVEA
jgi:hypothetical protein